MVKLIKWNVWGTLLEFNGLTIVHKRSNRWGSAEALELVPVPAVVAVAHWIVSFTLPSSSSGFSTQSPDGINQYTVHSLHRVNSSIEFGKSLIYHISNPIRAITIDWLRLCLWSNEYRIEYLPSERTNSNHIDCLWMDSRSFIRSLLPGNNDLDCNEGRHSFKKKKEIIMKIHIGHRHRSFELRWK